MSIAKAVAPLLSAHLQKVKGKHVHKIIIPGYNYHFLENGAVDSFQHGQTQGLQSKLKRNLNETVNGNLNETPSMSGDLCLYIHNYIQIDRLIYL